MVTGLLFLASAASGRETVEIVPTEVSGALLVYTAASLSPILRHVDHANREEALPAMLGVLLIPLLYSVHGGAGLAFVFYGILVVAGGSFTWAEHHTLIPLFVAALLLVAEIFSMDFAR